MPARIVFRDPSSGRFISRDVAEELGEVRRLEIGPSGVTEQPFSFFDEEEIEADPYRISQSQWGGRFREDDDVDLDLDRLASTPFPSGMDSFRVTLSGFPEYQRDKNPRGLKNTSWLGADMWPPDESFLEDFGAKGIAHIVFRAGR